MKCRYSLLSDKGSRLNMRAAYHFLMNCCVVLWKKFNLLTLNLLNESLVTIIDNIAFVLKSED